MDTVPPITPRVDRLLREQRSSKIVWIRLVKALDQEVPPERRHLIRELVAAETRAIEIIRELTGCRAWDGV